jgi:hypothetical protein
MLAFGAMGPALHEQLRPLAFLLGSWLGEGQGEWDGGDPFRYGEQMVFEHVGEPYLLYMQRSWDLGDRTAIHLERGFFRPAGQGRVEAALAHPLGIVEAAEGTLHEGVLDMVATTVGRTSTGSPATELRRRIEVRDGTLRYELWMATEHVPLARHLRGELQRA